MSSIFEHTKIETHVNIDIDTNIYTFTRSQVYKMATDLFQTQITPNPPIILVDSSGSVRDPFGSKMVFEKIRDFVAGLNEPHYRILFWNSNRQENSFFKNGIYKIPFIVKRETINQTFNHIQPNITQYCLTMPHLAFENVADEWIDDKNLTRIYFVTDGEMGYSNISFTDKLQLKEHLGRAIRYLFDKHNNVQLNIITFEPRIMNLTNTEMTQNAAGCDVYDVVMTQHLTRYISKFVSYTLNNENGFTHINRNLPPSAMLLMETSIFQF